VRTLTRCETVAAGASMLRLRFTANAFLHHMVRNIVGALVEVGAGRRDLAWVAAVLAARDRGMGAATFAAAGLYFAGVEYDPAFGLPPAGDSVFLP
jgi:tRNA pseudouridine38-40 synthase